MLYLIPFWFFCALFTVIKPGGVKKLVAENLALKKQLQILNRGHKRSPNLTISERIFFALCVQCTTVKRLIRFAIIIKPETILKFHRALVKKKYNMLFSNKSIKKPGPKGPSQQLIKLTLEIKSKNKSFGYRRIAMQIVNAFNIEVDKDVVRRILQQYYKPTKNNDGPSWLTFIGHMKDSLWSIDLFRCESITIKSYWVLVVMDQWSRNFIGFAVVSSAPTGLDVCRMFNKIISGKSLPKYLSSDNDPLFEYKKWKANMRVLDIKEIKTVPYVPVSHPFIERLIQTIKYEYLDKILFFNYLDLELKLLQFQKYYNNNRSHWALTAKTPSEEYCKTQKENISIDSYRWKAYARGLYTLPAAA